MIMACRRWTLPKYSKRAITLEREALHILFEARREYAEGERAKSQCQW